ncbi:MAG: thioredoxin [Bacteroidales bacterium]|jgi:thioredoxin 1|nr:thioredoxin [Bacteroidales bacterium]
MITEFTDTNFQTALTSNMPLMVDFWAEWCGPCRAIAPVVHELAAEYANSLSVGKVNVDENPEICEKYEIVNIPTILFFKNGNLIDTHIGAASKKMIIEKIKKVLE